MLQTAAGALWLPFTQMQGFDRSTRTFVRGEGSYLVDMHGHRVFDAVSSIWTTVHGHGHPAIVDAIARQAAQLDHATLLGAANPLAEELAERLAALTGMEYAFFASDGASAVEAALKMALHYWQHAGQPQRTRFVRLTGSYHGDTSGAMSVSDIHVFKSRYGAVTFESREYGSDSAVLHGDDVAAVIVEPVVQAAGGMQIVPSELYEPLRGMKPLLIVDEIATGFGRTGSMFAHEHLALRPDILCLGKGITGGALALSATMARERIYAAFLGEHGEMKQLFHGHSYAGNPIACAAALASLRLFETEGTLQHAAATAAAIAPDLAALRAHPAVRDVRGCGLMVGIEVESGAIAAHGSPTPAWRIADELYERGHFTRPIGNVVQLVPPPACAAGDVRAFLTDLHELLERG